MADVERPAKLMKRGAFLRFPGDYIFALADHRLLAIEDDPGAGRSIASDLKHVSVKGDAMGITGYDEGEFLERGLPSMAWDAQELQNIQKSWELVCRSGSTETLPVYEAKFRRKDGRPFWLRFDRLSQTPKTGRHMTIMHDVTTEVELRKERQARATAEATSRQFEKACAYLSHEIRNQLFPQIEILERIKSSAPLLSDDVDVILEANRAVAGILNSILDLAKWDAGAFPVKKQWCRLAPLLAVATRFGESKARGTSVSFSTSLRDIPDQLEVEADSTILNQAVTNLLSNALKFTSTGSVNLDARFDRTSDNEGRLTICVRDSGKGLTPESLTRVLLPFTQARTNEPGIRGTGLGLPLARVMIETGHGGTLKLESSGLGGGCVATALIDVKWREAAAPSLQEADPLAFVSMGKGDVDVLVVDDSAATRKMLVGKCERLGLTVEAAEDGRVALEKLRSKKYNLVSMDNQMPNDLSGVECVETARRAKYEGCVVLVSGDSFTEAARSDLLKRGVTAVLTKMESPSILDALGRLAALKKSARPAE